MKPRLLIVDDDLSIVEALSERFSAKGFLVTTALNGEEALSLARSSPDIILLDLQLPEKDGLSVLRQIHKEGIETTIIVITAYGSVKKAVEAMSEGAYDFLEKPFEPALVEKSIQRALERSSLQRENLAFRESRQLPGLIAEDPTMLAILKTAQKASQSNSTILLLGESGTGKEVLAQQIAAWSTRAKKPFVALNCAALSESLLESELFGHEKGAFTGANVRKRGKIELAHTGTLFLDEIGDISPAFQVKLLRVLQERSFERVGGNQSIEVDVRIIAATNRDLQKMVLEDTFRQDLFYRLHVITISLPPLRKRPQDIEALSNYFAKKLAQEAKRPVLALSKETLSILKQYHWPGNIRELRNAIERAVVLCEEKEIGPDDLPPDLRNTNMSNSSNGGFHEQVEYFRKQLIKNTVEKLGGNQTKAAKALSLQRTYLARLIKQYKL